MNTAASRENAQFVINRWLRLNLELLEAGC